MKVLNFLWHQYPFRLVFSGLFFPAAYYGLFRYRADTLVWFLVPLIAITLVLGLSIAWAIDAEKISHK